MLFDKIQLDSWYFAITILVAILLATISFYFSRYIKAASHRRKIKTANKVLEKLSKIQNPAQQINYLRKINPFVFEELLLTAFSRKGLAIVRNKKYTGDGGLDGVIYDGDQKIIIQAKRYSGHVNKAHIENFSDLCRKNSCRGYFIHTGKTPKNFDEEKQSQIDIISGSKLINLISYSKC